MKKQLTRADIQAKIAQLEQTTALMEADLKRQVVLKVEYYKPGNILKRVVGGFATLPLPYEGFLTAAITTGAGFLGKKIVVAQVKRMRRKVTRNLLQFGLKAILSKAGMLAHLPEQIASATKKVVK